MWLVIRILCSWVVLLTRLYVDGPVICVTLLVAFRRGLHQAKVDGHQVVIFIVGVCDTGAAVTQPEAPQPLGQVARKGSSTAFADDWTAGSVDLSAQGDTVKAGEVAQQLGTLAVQMEAYCSPASGCHFWWETGNTVYYTSLSGDETHSLVGLSVLAA